MSTTIVYFTSIPDTGAPANVFFEPTLGLLLFILACLAIFLVITVLLASHKLSKNYERARAKKQLSDNDKKHEKLRMKHFKIRNQLIYENGDIRQNNKKLEKENELLNNKLIQSAEKNKDLSYGFTRRGEKIKKVDLILRQDDPNRSCSSLIKQFKDFLQ
jgi:uncharacterized membrane protein YhiD involved in acid resistance